MRRLEIGIVLVIGALIGWCCGLCVGSLPRTVTAQVMPEGLIVFPGETGPELIDFGLVHLDVVVQFVGKQATPIPVLFSHGRDARHGVAAAGFVTSCSARDDGLYCDFSWTQYGRNEACTGAWRYMSPRFAVTRDANAPIVPAVPVELSEISLTNMPRFDGMRAVPVPSCVGFPWQAPRLQ